MHQHMFLKAHRDDPKLADRLHGIDLPPQEPDNPNAYLSIPPYKAPSEMTDAELAAEVARRKTLTLPKGKGKGKGKSK